MSSTRILPSKLKLASLLGLHGLKPRCTSSVPLPHAVHSPGDPENPKLLTRKISVKLLGSPSCTLPSPDPIKLGVHGTSPAKSSASFGSTHRRRKAPATSFLAIRIGTFGKTVFQKRMRRITCTCKGCVAGGCSSLSVPLLMLRWSWTKRTSADNVRFGSIFGTASNGDDAVCCNSGRSALTTSTRCLATSFMSCRYTCPRFSLALGWGWARTRLLSPSYLAGMPFALISLR